MLILWKNKFLIFNQNYIEKDRENNKHLKVHEKLTHSRKLVEGMKAGLKPDIFDDENGDDDVNELNRFKL